MFMKSEFILLLAKLGIKENIKEATEIHFLTQEMLLFLSLMPPKFPNLN